MISRLVELVKSCGLAQEGEDVRRGEDVEESFRIFAMNFDVKPFLELIKDLPGSEEVLEELDVDTCEPDFVSFFLSDVYEEYKEEIDKAFKELKQYEPSIGLAALALYTILRKIGNPEELLERVKC